MVGAGAGLGLGPNLLASELEQQEGKNPNCPHKLPSSVRCYMPRTRRCSIGLRKKGEGVAGREHRALFWVGISALVIAVVAAATFEILLSRAEPILRARLLQSLSARFHSRVEMGAFDVSLLRGFEVSGKDLAIYPYNIAVQHADVFGAPFRLSHRLFQPSAFSHAHRSR